MRKMAISFGWSRVYVGDADVVMKIADLIEDKLDRVERDYVNGDLHYHYVEDDGVKLEILNKEDEVKPIGWYEEQVAKRHLSDESNAVQ